MIENQIFLIHGDATNLVLPETSLNMIWSVQAYQHIPDFELAVRESHRVLVRGGVFINYSLNRVRLVEWLYRLMEKHYHIEGKNGAFYLARASGRQKELLATIFGSEVESRFTEILFQPRVKWRTFGKEGSIIGYLDAWLGGRASALSWVARQESFHVVKA
jgi:ubiquinone/menaquinone biosynthesis C-methylase UbiE